MRTSWKAHRVFPLWRRSRAVVALTASAFALGPLSSSHGADIARAGRSTAAEASASTPATGNPAGVPEMAKPNAQVRLDAARDGIAAVRAMQAAARELAAKSVAAQQTGTNTWNLGLDPSTNKAVTVSSGLSTNGLLPEGGVTKIVETSTGTYVVPANWTGIESLAQTSTGSGTSTTVNVTIKQNSQQSVLNWDKFNVAPNTTVAFDQTKGGADVANWIAFNKINAFGAPSQIFGSIKADGQVYVINPNGVIFGGTSQVNARSLVASSLPINDNLIARGLLNNPDSQFLFSGLKLPSGTQTDAFSPRMSETFAAGAAGLSSISSTRTVADPGSLVVNYAAADSGPKTLSASDYSVNTNADGTLTVALTVDAAAKTGNSLVKLSYTPTANKFGDVVVQGGADLRMTTSAEKVGGRVALVGPNVKNAGTISTPDGQIILAAGLQVGVGAHTFDAIKSAVAVAPGQAPETSTASDPSLRGLDVFVGQVTYDGAPASYSAGVVTNDRTTSGGTTIAGLLQTTDLYRKKDDGTPAGPVDVPGSVLMTGKTVNQLGTINSVTTVSFNGRVDLLANYNAVPNPGYDSTQGGAPFVFPEPNAAAKLQATGTVKLGDHSLIQIMPSGSTTDKINNALDAGLSLKSSVNIQGRAIYFGSAVDAANNVSGAAIRAPNADVNLLAGEWRQRIGAGSTPYQINTFLYNGGQIYLDRGATIDVAGTQGATASVTDNIITAELRGPELADSPLQRDGILRGQKVQIDTRVHGPWNPTLNNGKGGYEWIGTPVGDVRGYVNLVQRDAGQLTVNGGNVNVFAGGSVVMQPGSKIDVAGGWIDYAGGRIQTTKVISQGHIYDISQATPEKVYDAVFDGSTTRVDPKWGVTEKSVNDTLLGYYDNGYSYGGSGGKVSIATPSAALDGRLTGLTWSGERQVLTQPQSGTYELIARPAQLELRFQGTFFDSTPLSYAPFAPNVFFQSGSELAASAPAAAFKEDATGAYALAKSRQDEVDLAPSLVSEDGFGFLLVDVSDDNHGATGRKGTDYGRITVPGAADGKSPVLKFGRASALATTYGLSSLNLKAANIDVLGGIVAPGGVLTMSATNVSASQAFDAVASGPISTPNKNRGMLTLGSTGFLDVSGEVLDLRLPGVSESSPRSTGGGNIALSGYKVAVTGGSTMSVAGGAAVSAAQKVTWGNAGKLSIQALNEQAFSGATLSLPNSYANPDGKTAYPLMGYSGAKGGSLTLRAPLIQVGGTAATKSSLALQPGFFESGGFTNYSIVGLADPKNPAIPSLWIGAPVVDATDPLTTTGQKVLSTQLTLNLQPKSYQADFTKYGKNLLQTYLPELPYRSPVSLSFAAVGKVDASGALPAPGDLLVESGASLTVSANAASSISLKGDTVTVFGKLSVPGGEISIADESATRSLLQTGDVPVATVYLGPKSSLSTAGVAATTKDGRGYTVGSILSGGEISVSGNLVAAKGAKLDASGASGAISVSPFQSTLSPVVNTAAPNLDPVSMVVDSDGGKISLAGGQMLFSDATLIAKPGAAAGKTSTALGGSLEVSSGFYNLLNENLPLVTTTVLYDAGPTIPVPFSSGETAVKKSVLDEDDAAVSPSVYQGVKRYGAAISTDSFASGGFEWLSFPGVVEYSGSVALRAGSGIKIGTTAGQSAGLIRAASGGEFASSLSLTAPFVALGQEFLAPGQQVAPADASYGDGTLTVKGAKLIEVGRLALQNIGTVDLRTNAGGEIRGDGTLEMAGDLNLTAGQIYPATATDFTIAVNDYVLKGKAQSGTITVNRAGTVTQAPLSAGGSLSLYASAIEQDGILRAPMGKITLGLDPSSSVAGKSYPTAKSVTLGAGSVTSVSTLDLATGKPLSTPIPYGLNLDGTSWIDPTGADISAGDPAGRLAKSVSFFADTIDHQPNATVDLAGGGDLFAYRWVRGVNGQKDILSSDTNSFAILPGYNGYAPYGAFNSATQAVNLGGDPGYVSSKLKVGDTLLIDLDATDAVGAQSYTLLPARYALLPGAYLVTPKGTIPSGSVSQPDGSTLVSAYRYNALNPSRTVQPVYSLWEVAPGQSIKSSTSTADNPVKPVDVVRLRAQYDGYLANAFFADAAVKRSLSVPRLPVDAGQLVYAPLVDLKLDGKVNAQPLLGADGKPAKNADGSQIGRGGLIDIGSPLDTYIVGADTDTSDLDSYLVLDTQRLNSFGAESLLIGGIRQNTADGKVVRVTTNNLWVDNGSPLGKSPVVALQAPDLILAANRNVAVAPGSVVQQSGALPDGAAPLTVSGTVAIGNGETVGFARGNVPIVFTSGTTETSSLIASVDVTVTSPDGASTTTFVAGDPITFAANSTLTLKVDDTIPAGQALTLTATTDPGQKIAMRTGDGALLRVSADPTARVSRTNVALTNLAPTDKILTDPSIPSGYINAPGLYVFGGAKVSGGTTGSVILDSTNQTQIIADTLLNGRAITLNSRRIGLSFDGSLDDFAAVQGRLPLTGKQLSSLEAAGMKSLSLSSYSTIDIFGEGTIGSANLEQLSLSAGQLLNNNGGSATFTARKVTLGNLDRSGEAPSLTSAPAGKLALIATGTGLGEGVIQLGSAKSTGEMRIDGFSEVNLNASQGVVLAGTGGLSVRGSGGTTPAPASLTVAAPLITTADYTDQTIFADGALILHSATAAGTNLPTAGLGGKITLLGDTVINSTRVYAPSGYIAATATGGDLSIGGTFDVSGVARTFVDVIRFTPGGQIDLTASQGKISLESTGRLDVSAALLPASAGTTPTRYGNAGSLLLRSPDTSEGVLALNGTLAGFGGSGTNDTAGSFYLDLGTVDPSQKDVSLKALGTALNAGGFTQERAIRVRAGNVLLDGVDQARSFALSADAGDITVTGKIDASGPTGGAIALSARGSVVLEAGSELTVKGQQFDAAGKGGAIQLSAGTSLNGVPADDTAMIDVRGASNNLAAAQLDLSVGTPTVTLSAGMKYVVPVQIPAENLLSSDVPGKITYADGSVQAFTKGFLPPLPAGATIALDSDGALTLAGGMLALRAPQLATADPLKVDVQIARFGGSIVGAGGVVVEGYKTYVPPGGYIDAVKNEIDRDAQLFAGETNVDALREAKFAALPKRLLHIQPGAEIVSPGQDTWTWTTFTLASTGTNSSLTAPADSTLILPSTTTPASPGVVNELFFSSAVTITPTVTSSYSVAKTLQKSSDPSLANLAVTATSSLKLSSSTNASLLESTVGGVIRPPSGAPIPFEAGLLSAATTTIPANSIIEFTGSGAVSLSSTATNSLTFDYRDSLVAGVATKLPTNSTVLLTSDGGKIAFKDSGSLSWRKSTNTTASLQIQLATKSGSFASTAVDGKITVGQGNAWTTIGLKRTNSSFAEFASGVAVVLPTGTGTNSGEIKLSLTGSNRPLTNTITLDTTESSGAVLSLNAGDVILAPKGASILDTATTSLSATDAEPHAFSSNGGAVTFSGKAKVTITGNARIEGAGAVQAIKSGTVVNIPAGATIAFSGVGTIAVTDVDSEGAAIPVPVTVRNYLSTSEATTLTAAAKVQLSNFADQVTLTSSMPVVLASNAAVTVRASAQTRVALSKGNDLNLTAASGASFTVNGASISNREGADLLLARTWDLSGYRYGAGAAADATVGFVTPGAGEPGALTIRAAGNLVFDGTTSGARASLSDGFGPAPASSSGGLWQAPLLPAGSASWSYRLVAGADLAAANYRDVLASNLLGLNTGSIIVGQGTEALPQLTSSTRINVVPRFYQSIRTGTGDISLVAARDISLQNSLATIYTAGTQVSQADSLFGKQDFDVPLARYPTRWVAGQNYGTPYPAQYSYGGGNVRLDARGQINRKIVDGKGGLVDDSVRQMPANWLYRRGYVDTTTGNFGAIASTSDTLANVVTETASTTWWSDFTNFFQGVGALGGGNVTLAAGDEVRNVDAVIPTNERMSKQLPNGNRQAISQMAVELGGGNLSVRSGTDISAGTFYVERGTGSLNAGGSITTNSTRSTASLLEQSLLSPGQTTDPVTWLPTTLFLGKGSFDLFANNEITMGPVANPFLTVPGINNSPYEATFFSTASPNNRLTVSTLAGDVTIKGSNESNQGTLWGWYASHLYASSSSYSGAQPWLRLIDSANPSSVGALRGFATATSLLPADTRVVAQSGSIKLAGAVTVASAPFGTLELLAAEGVDGFQPVALESLNGDVRLRYAQAVVNVSDADPASIAGPKSPIARPIKNVPTSIPSLGNVLSSLERSFTESGATSGINVVLQTQQALHGKNPDSTAGAGEQALHGSDKEPVRVYAKDGDITGLELFTPKFARLSASRDISDVDLYIQNSRADSITTISAGRDIKAYDPNSSARRSAALRGGTFENDGLGDIQISGPGTLQIAAGRDIDLGAPLNPVEAPKDGRGVGITSIGNTRNPNLPFSGADLAIAAGVGDAAGLNSASLVFDDTAFGSGFVDQFLNPARAGTRADRYLPQLGELLGFTIDPKKPTAQNAQIWKMFNDPSAISTAQRRLLALEIFYAALRDAGRDYNDKNSANYGNYDNGYAAVAALLGSKLGFADFNKAFVATTDQSRADRVLPLLGAILSLPQTASRSEILAAFNAKSAADQNLISAQLFARVLALGQADAKGIPGAFTRKEVVESVFPTASTTSENRWQGDISLSSREIRTTNGGDIQILAPGGGLSLGRTLESEGSTTPPGIITQYGGKISIYAHDSVEVGVSRIFTLRGGDVTIWSTTGNIAAGSSSKTVQSAPPTRVLVDPQSAAVKTDLAGLATGGGIGVLATVEGVKPGFVDLIAPAGTVDAGDAGIRATGGVNIAAAVVLNASNIQSPSTTGTPPPPPAPDTASVSAAAKTAGAASSAATDSTKPKNQMASSPELPSLFNVEVLGYGGSEEVTSTAEFSLILEGRQVSWNRNTITLPELRQLAGWPPGTAVEEELPDGTKRLLEEDEVVTLPDGTDTSSRPKYNRR